MTADLIEVFKAGRVRRWHANAALAETVDPLDGHSARVARIILALHPAPTFELLRAALTHDDGERVTGDLPPSVKGKFAGLDKIEGDAVFDLWYDFTGVTDYDDGAWIYFADKLDAAMWVAWHRPAQLHTEDWQRSINRLIKAAVELGADVDVPELIYNIASEVA